MNNQEMKEMERKVKFMLLDLFYGQNRIPCNELQNMAFFLLENSRFGPMKTRDIASLTYKMGEKVAEKMNVLPHMFYDDSTKIWSLEELTSPNQMPVFEDINALNQKLKDCVKDKELVRGLFLFLKKEFLLQYKRYQKRTYSQFKTLFKKQYNENFFAYLFHHQDSLQTLYETYNSIFGYVNNYKFTYNTKTNHKSDYIYHPGVTIDTILESNSISKEEEQKAYDMILKLETLKEKVEGKEQIQKYINRLTMAIISGNSSYMQKERENAEQLIR